MNQRPIEFIVWDFQKNRWAHQSDVLPSMGLTFGTDDYYTNIAGERMLRFKFCQFIGITDSCGEKLYEGDVVIVKGTKSLGDYLTVIEWSQTGFRLKSNKTYVNDRVLLPSMMTRVANIYSHPEYPDL